MIYGRSTRQSKNAWDMVEAFEWIRVLASADFEGRMKA